MFTAWDVADGNSGFPFGCNQEKLAQELHQLAEKLEKHEVSLQRLVTAQIAQHEDYEVNRVIIQYCEAKEKTDVAKK